MRTAFKWRLSNYQYVFITDETDITIKNKLTTIGGPFIYNTLTTERIYSGKVILGQVDEDKISEIVSEIEKTTYCANFSIMTQLVYNQGFGITFQDCNYYFNLTENSCASSVSNQIQGPQGIMGIKGEDGPIGAQGAEGAQGKKGEMGPQGPRGGGGSGSVTHGATKVIYRRSADTLTLDDIPTNYKITIEGMTFVDNDNKWYDNDPGTTEGENLWISFGSFTWEDETEITNGVNWGKPADCSGEPGTDSGGYHFIYYRTNMELNTMGYVFEPVKYVPDSENRVKGKEAGKEWVEWNESPEGIEVDNRFEYMAVSQYNSDTKEWSNWVGPVLWSRWGENGTDGDGVEYIYCSAKEGVSPVNPTPNNWNELDSKYQRKNKEFIPGSTDVGEYETVGGVTIKPNAIDGLSGGTWNDEPKGTSREYPYEYVAMRKYRTGNDNKKIWQKFSDPKNWVTDSSMISKTLTTKIIYPMGEWNDDIEYSGNTDSAPYVTYDKKMYVLIINGKSKKQKPNEHSEVWKEGGAQQDVTYTKLLLADNALVGQAVFNGDYMFSQSGITSSGEVTRDYGKFIKDDPFNNNNEFRPNWCVNFMTGEQWLGAGKIYFKGDGSGFLASENLWWDKNGNLYGRDAEFKGVFATNVTHLTAKNRGEYLIPMGSGQTSTKKHEAKTTQLSMFGNYNSCDNLTWGDVFNNTYSFSFNMRKLNGTFVFHENTSLIISFPSIHYIDNGMANDVSFNPLLTSPNGGYRPCNISDLNSFLNTVVTFKNESSVEQKLVLYGDIRAYNENNSIPYRYIDNENGNHILLGSSGIVDPEEGTVGVMADAIGLAPNDNVTLRFIKENNGYRWEVLNHGTEQVESPAFFADEESNSYYMPRQVGMIHGKASITGGNITEETEDKKTDVGYKEDNLVCTLIQSCAGFRTTLQREEDVNDTLIGFSSHECFVGNAKETGIAIEPDAIGCDFQIISPYYEIDDVIVMAQLIFNIQTGTTEGENIGWKQYVYKETSTGYEISEFNDSMATPDISKNYWLSGGIGSGDSTKPVNKYFHIDFNKIPNFIKERYNYITVNYAYYKLDTTGYRYTDIVGDEGELEEEIMKNTRPILVFNY